MVCFERNQAVWVATGDQEELLMGIVVRVGCPLTTDSDDQPDELSSDNRESNMNGIEVKIPVTGERHIVDASLLRHIEDVSEKMEGMPRRSNRGKTANNVSPPLVTPEQGKGRNTKKLALPDVQSSGSANPACKQKPEFVPSGNNASNCKNRRSQRQTTEGRIVADISVSSSPYFSKRKRSDTDSSDEASESSSSPAGTANNSRKKTNKKTRSITKVTSSEDLESVAQKPPPKRRGKIKKDDVDNHEIIVTKKAHPEFIVREASSDESEVENFPMEDDYENDDDKAFTVELAATGRATCRTCDKVISKWTLRVSHVPLFRGKPGYRVYRHLKCAMFPDEVRTIQDVSGWRNLKPSDRKRLEERIEESKRLIAKESEELQPDELVQVEFQGEIRKSPAGLSGVNLLPFQIEGASWMYHQERHIDEIRGGILADEMGMGKTVQTIVTILDNRPKLQHSKPGAKHPPRCPDVQDRQREEGLWSNALQEWKNEMKMNNVSSSVTSRKPVARAGTLVICPLVALSQWKAEIEKFTEPDTLSVCVYHGTDRAAETPLVMLQKYDVVLTTFQVLEQDFRKMVSPNKVTCPNCNAKFKIDKLRIHLKYFCGENAQRTEAQARQQRANERDAPTSSSRDGKNSKSKSKVGSKKKPLKNIPMTDLDSDDELSNAEDVLKNATSCRPCRSAAKTATKKVSASVQQWKDNDTSESSYNSESDEEERDDESEGGTSPQIQPIRAKSNSALEKARKKQETAMQNAKKSTKKKSFQKKGKKSFPKKKGKKFEDESDKESDGAEPEPLDPLDGIDLDLLMEEAMAGSKQSPLHSLLWWRVILDEAHFIKSRSSQTAAAAFALTSVHRWCLSGTPLQNRVGELYSLIRFLRINPMGLYFCRQKGCTCKNLHYRMQNGMCQDCGHRSFSHFSYFNKHVLNPIQRDGYSGDGRRAMFTLKNEVLDKCLLRRTKQTRAADMELPPRFVSIRYVRLHPVEEDFYQSLYMETKASFDDYVQAGTLLNNYAHIFDLLTKMRQATNHPYMVVHNKKNASKYAAAIKGPEVANGSIDCDMCHEPPTDRVLSSCCGAAFCRSCVIEYLTGAVGERTPCPSCTAPFTIDLNQASVEDAVDDGVLTFPSSEKVTMSKQDIPSLKEMSHVATGSILRRINLAEFATSTKIEVLVQELIEMREKRPGSKALVFSQFVNMLDLVRWRLHSDPVLADRGLGVQILHGGMDAKSRDAALKTFREDNNCRVLLMSLKAAGVALNLTVASECFLMDLWWNPAAEMQAIDRTHRLGQYRPIRAVRLVAEGTVEERVLQLQEKKRLVFDGTIGRDAGSLKMLTVDDMKALFA